MQGLAAWLRTEAPARRSYLTAAAIGLGIYLIVFGPSVMFGASAYWDLPLTDHRAYLMGYRYLLHEPWHWPVFVVHTMNVPFDKSIAFSDAIPVWALLNKLVATIVPPWAGVSERAYLGLWYAILYVLQPLLAVANLRVLGRKSWAATISVALLFVAAPAWINRYEHASMSAHFLTLWAIYLYLRTPSGERAPRRLRVQQLGQLGLATLVNPYHAVMSYGFCLASVLRTRVRKELVWAAAGFGVIGACAWFANYFAKEASLKMFGFEVASTNILSFVMPFRSGLLGDALYSDPTGFQYEGAAFAGLGMLVLLAVFVPRARNLGAVIKRHRYLFALALAAWVFALSTQIWFGPYEILGYSLPSRLGWLADQFRSPGRFVWVPMYVAMLFLAKEGLARFKDGWKIFLVPALAVLQLVDGFGGWSPLREKTRGPFHATIAVEPWRALVGAHEAVFVYPSYDCVLDGTPNMDHVSLEIEYFASERAIPINGVYTARPTRICELDEVFRERATPEPHTLYVFLRRDQATAYRFASLGASCGEFEYGRACSLDKAAIEAAMQSKILGPVSQPPPLPDIAFGTPLEITPAADPALFVFGWSWAETRGRFTDGPFARLGFHLTGAPSAAPKLTLTASAVICGGRKLQDIELAINGTAIGHIPLSDADKHTVSVPIPPALLRASSIYLDLRVRDSRRLNLIGCNNDYRGLGIHVEQVSIE